MTSTQQPVSGRGRGRRLSRALGGCAVVSGLAVLCMLVWQLWWTDLRVEERSEMLVSSLRQDFDAAAAVQATIVSGRDQSPSQSAEAPEVTGAVVHLPTIGEVHPVLPGVGADVLNEGVLGRYPGSTDPGEIGNYAVAGHRTTYGRPLWALGELTEGDPVVVETADAYHVYVVHRLRVVEPDASEVLAPLPDRPGAEATEPRMVLTTCHPRFSAQQRLVAYAVLSQSVLRSEGPPPELETARG